jgi:phosphotransferase system  glucose/maltose/N-acetylglucosamine-specific IIC component
MATLYILWTIGIFWLIFVYFSPFWFVASGNPAKEEKKENEKGERKIEAKKD